MTSEQTASKSDKDRLAKWVFLGLAVVAATLVWLVQRNPSILKGWETNLPQALADGRAQHRPVLIFFHDIPMNQASAWIAGKHLCTSQSMAAYEKYNYVKVRVGTETSSSVAREWKLTGFPTLVVVDASGKEVMRYQGSIPLSEFWERLLPAAKSASTSTPATGERQP
jgi:hypothetical protein